MHKLISIFTQILDILRFYIYGSVNYARFKGVKLGENCRIYIKNWGAEPFLITIGDRVTITSGVRLITHDGSTCLFRDKNGYRYQKYMPITIGSDVFIGVNSIIMPGINIGSKVVIGAGSIITKDIPSNSVAVGNPAKIISDFESLERKIKNTCISNGEINEITGYKEKVFKAIELSRLKNEK